MTGRARRAGTFFLLGVVAVALVAPIFRFPARWGDPYDWRYFQASEEVARTSLADYRQAPLWNPYMCGGEVALANPQSTAASPTILFSLIFGTPLGLKLSLVLLLFCALDGAYRLGRRHGLSTTAALTTAFTFGTSGWFALHLSTGHLNFAGAALYPYLLLGYRRAVEERGRSALFGLLFASAIVAWIVGLGGTYTAPMGAVLLGLYAAGDALVRRHTRPLVMALAIGAIAVALGAVRLFPVMEFALDHPRHVPEHDGSSPFELLQAFLAWRQRLAPFAGHRYWWHEFCCHLPYLAVALAVCQGLRTARRRDLLPLAAVALWSLAALALPAQDRYLERHLLGYRDAQFLLWAIALVGLFRGASLVGSIVLVVALGIAAGAAWPHGPWWLLRKLPLYRDLRVPSRYLILGVLPLALWAGGALDWLRTKRLPGFTPARLGAAIAAIVLVEGVAFTMPTFQRVFTLVHERHGVVRPRFYQADGDIRMMFAGVVDGRGTLKCDEEAPLQRGELDSVRPQENPDEVEQVRLLDPAAGSVSERRWSPNAVTFALDLASPTDVLVNQNWNEHWKVRDGDCRVKSVAGRLGVACPAGRREVMLYYRPRSFVVGAWVSGTSWAIAFLIAVWRRRQVASRDEPRSDRRYNESCR